MKLIIKKGTTSKIVQIFIQDSSMSDGSGLTGLVYNSAGLSAYYIREGDASATAITLADATVGTYTSGGFKEVDATNMPGIYELHPPNACFASGADQVVIFLKGATNMAPLPIEIQLVDNTEKDIYDRIGAPAGASIAVDVADIPTVAEFNARTLLAADYFDPAADTVANVTLVDTTTTNTDMRGTDGANTTTPPTVTEIRTEMDTNSTKMAPSQNLDDYKATGFAVPGEYDTQMGYIPSDLGDVPTGSELDAAHGAGSWEGIPGSIDWSPAERKQIRDALGVDGNKTDVADSRIVDDIKKHDNKITGLLM